MGTPQVQLFLQLLIKSRYFTYLNIDNMSNSDYYGGGGGGHQGGYQQQQNYNQPPQHQYPPQPNYNQPQGQYPPQPSTRHLLLNIKAMARPRLRTLHTLNSSPANSTNPSHTTAAVPLHLTRQLPTHKAVLHILPRTLLSLLSLNMATIDSRFNPARRANRSVQMAREDSEQL